MIDSVSQREVRREHACLSRRKTAIEHPAEQEFAETARKIPLEHFHIVAFVLNTHTANLMVIGAPLLDCQLYYGVDRKVGMKATYAVCEPSYFLACLLRHRFLVQ